MQPTPLLVTKHSPADGSAHVLLVFSFFAAIHAATTIRTTLGLHSLLLYRLDAMPFPLQVLLPQGDLVVASADGQHVPAQTPAHPP